MELQLTFAREQQRDARDSSSRPSKRRPRVFDSVCNTRPWARRVLGMGCWTDGDSRSVGGLMGRCTRSARKVSPRRLNSNGAAAYLCAQVAAQRPRLIVLPFEEEIACSCSHARYVAVLGSFSLSLLSRCCNARRRGCGSQLAAAPSLLYPSLSAPRGVKPFAYLASSLLARVPPHAQRVATVNMRPQSAGRGGGHVGRRTSYIRSARVFDGGAGLRRRILCAQRRALIGVLRRRGRGHMVGVAAGASMAADRNGSRRGGAPWSTLRGRTVGAAGKLSVRDERALTRTSVWRLHGGCPVRDLTARWLASSCQCVWQAATPGVRVCTQTQRAVN